MISPMQVRMARAALGSGVRELGMKAGISANTVSRFENGGGAMVETLIQIQTALERAGVFSFPPINKGGLKFGCATFPPVSRNEGGSR
jgi:transcriptional regulator with XRE-family HTH domain